jgi:hypothetical protein
MSGHFFGLGKGHLSRRVEKAAERAGGQLVNYTDPQCNCGYGCRPYSCRASARHWFVVQDKQMAGQVLEAAYAAATREDRAVGFERQSHER